MWTPTHVVVTVTKARNLLEKGKGGNDAYCMIGMGKEKFLTSVKSKTLCPVWDEQAEFELGEREDLKITVYHKSSIIDEFVGRVVINVPELATQDNNHSYITWYKLCGKPEKSEKSKKPEKERGEIEVRVDFIIKPKAGSMMDLSLKNKEKSLSLRNLKEKMSNKKGSFSDKLKFKKSGQPKYSGENQLAEQAKRMGGSKLDFLDGDDIGSITSSYSSINGPTLSRGNTGQFNSMSRFNPNRQSYVSRTSSRQENDNSSYGNDASRNEDEEDFNDYFKNDENENSDRDSANGSSFQRRGSSRFGSSLSRSISRRQSGNKSNSTETTNAQDEPENAGSIHIAPLLPFNNGTSTPQSTPRLNHHEIKVSEKKTRHKTSSSIVATIDEENILSVKSPAKSSPKSPVKNPEPTAALDSFASIFTASLNNDSNNSKANIETKNEHTDSRSTITDSLYDKSQSSVNETSITSSHSKQKSKAPVADLKTTPPTDKKLPTSNNPFIDEESLKKSDLKKQSSNPFLDDDEEVTSVRSSHKKQAPIIPVITKNAKNINNFPMANDDYEDNIEWDSSEDEEIVKNEVASFERNQVLENQLTLTKKIETKTSLEPTKPKVQESFLKILPPIDSFNLSVNKPKLSEPPLSKTIINHQKLPERSFPTASTFSIDIDPFSSSSSASSVASFKVDLIQENDLPVKDTSSIPDPFGADLFKTNPTLFDQKVTTDDPFKEETESNSFEKDLSDPFTEKSNKSDPFSIFDTINTEKNLETSIMSLKIDDIPPLDFSKVEELNGSTAYDEPDTESSENKDFESPKEIKELEIKPENEVIEHNDAEIKPKEVAEIKNEEKEVKEEEVSEKSDQDSEPETKFDIKVDSDEDDDDEQKDEQTSKISIQKPNSAFLKKHSYDTIMSLDLQGGGSRKNSNESEESEDLSKRFNFTLEGAVEDETSDDVEQAQEDVSNEPNSDSDKTLDSNTPEARSTLSNIEEEKKSFVQIKTIMRQSERRRLVPVEDLTSDLNSETDFNHSTCSIASSARNRHVPSVQKPLSNRNTMQLDLKSDINYNRRADSSDEIKTPDFDDAFQDHVNDKNKLNSTHGSDQNSSGLPDLINQKGNKDVPTDKARKYLEGLDGVKFNEIQVPDSLKKQLEYFDRDELLQLIAYQKKYLDFKEGRIKDLENYIDNLVVKIIEVEPLILMNASNVLSKGRNLI